MKYSEAKLGRAFVIRLENGDVVHESIEQFAKEHDIKAASLIVLGGADKESQLLVGPEEGRSIKIIPITEYLENVHEVTGTGTLFPDEEDQPVLHMHMACGRNKKTITGCIRNGIKTWHIMEIILFELVATTASRKRDPQTGFKLLQP